MAAKIALVTGAGSGIGRAVAHKLASNGFEVVLTGRTRNRLEGVAREIGTRAHVMQADVCDADSVADLFEAIRLKFARLDILFNNAGVSAPAQPLDTLPLS